MKMAFTRPATEIIMPTPDKEAINCLKKNPLSLVGSFKVRFT